MLIPTSRSKLSKLLKKVAKNLVISAKAEIQKRVRDSCLCWNDDEYEYEFLFETSLQLRVHSAIVKKSFVFKFLAWCEA